ncbi:MAG: phosphate--acyl-ACP acyltransferase, partial [Oscillospiraceae bacterium]|nr:phosphate--acyl-ACP acyltransferase [Oscillospiraceae bacterium]
MKILLDVMGGDHAPLETVKGAALAAEELAVEVILVGDEKKINQVIEQNSLSKKNLEIAHTEKTISM